MLSFDFCIESFTPKKKPEYMRTEFIFFLIPTIQIRRYVFLVGSSPNTLIGTQISILFLFWEILLSFDKVVHEKPTLTK